MSYNKFIAIIEMIDVDIYKNPTLNIGILGYISSEKSTLMNSLFRNMFRYENKKSYDVSTSIQNR